jgi:hypothetical protein
MVICLPFICFHNFAYSLNISRARGAAVTPPLCPSSTKITTAISGFSYGAKPANQVCLIVFPAGVSKMFYQKQIIWACVGLFVFWILYSWDYRKLLKGAPLLYALSLFFLLLRVGWKERKTN